MIDRRSFVDVFSSVNGHDVVGTGWKKRAAKIVASIDGVQRADHAKQTGPSTAKLKSSVKHWLVLPTYNDHFLSFEGQVPYSILVPSPLSIPYEETARKYER